MHVKERMFFAVRIDVLLTSETIDKRDQEIARRLEISQDHMNVLFEFSNQYVPARSAPRVEHVQLLSYPHPSSNGSFPSPPSRLRLVAPKLSPGGPGLGICEAS